MNDELGLGIAFSFNHNSADGEYKSEKNEATTNTFSLVASLTFN
jgi:hypothetical protein